MSEIMVRTMAVAAVAIPTLLLVAGAVVIATCMPLLTIKRQQAARDAISALTRLAEVIHGRHAAATANRARRSTKQARK